VFEDILKTQQQLSKEEIIVSLQNPAKNYA